MRDAARLTVTDDDLSAFLDGELPQEALKRVTAALDADETLRRRLEKLAYVDRVLTRAYSAGGEKPMPAWVTALLADAAPLRRGNRNFLFALLAAAIALAIGGAAFLEARENAWPTLLYTGPIDTASALHAALEGTPSGGAAVLPPEGRATIVGSFHPTPETFCREFTVTSPDGAARAIACRGEGVWTIEIAAPKDTLSPAYGAAAKTLGAETPLTSAAETKLLHSNWAE